MRWWWFGPAVTKPEIKLELEHPCNSRLHTRLYHLITDLRPLVAQAGDVAPDQTVQ